MGILPMRITGVPPVSLPFLCVSCSEPQTQPRQQKQQQQDRAKMALEHTGKMPVPRTGKNQNPYDPIVGIILIVVLNVRSRRE
jgi:hypothetical protein